MGGIDEIDDPNAGLVRVFPMQAAGVLLQRAFPGHRHRQDQCIAFGDALEPGAEVIDYPSFSV